MGEYLISPNLAGSAATYTASGTTVALDVNLTSPITIGSLSVSAESIFVQSGTIFVVSGNAWSGVGSVRIAEQGVNPFITFGSQYILETNPKATNKNNPAYKLEYAYSGTATGLTGSAIGSITQFIGTGSYVRVLTYNGGFLTSIGSYV